jgi:hypothetical protein
VVKSLSNFKGGLDMGKKSKLILATALFGAALFGASCGGGDDGAPTAGTGTGSGGGSGGGSGSAPPPAPAVATVLVAAVAQNNAADVRVFEGTVRGDGTINWSTNLLSRDLDYYHEFSNGSVLLYDRNDNSLFRYTTGNPTQLTNVTDVNNDTTRTLTTTAGFANTTVGNIFLPNFVVIHDGNDLRIITSSGAVVQVRGAGAGNPARLVYAGRDYLVVRNGAANEHVYIVRQNGSVTVLDWNDAATGNQPITNGQVQLLDRVQGTDIILLGPTPTTSANAIYVILEDGTAIRITNTGGDTGDDPVANLRDGKIRRDANGNIFVAIRYQAGADTPIQYYRISPAGNVEFRTNPITITGHTIENRRDRYALDGSGRLYVMSRPTSGGTNYHISTRTINIVGDLGPNDLSIAFATNNANLLALADRVLVISRPVAGGPPNQVRFMSGTGSVSNDILPSLTSNIRDALELCSIVNENSRLTAENGLPYSGITQEPVVGEGTNSIMCASAFHVAARNLFAWLRFDGTSYSGSRVNNVSGGAGPSEYLMATANGMIFRLDDQTFYECNFGATSCAARNLSGSAFQNVYNSNGFTANVKIKSDNNILSDGAGFAYLGRWRGFAPNIRAAYFTNAPSTAYIANIQTGVVNAINNPTYTVRPPSGGNISLDFNRGAALINPPAGAQCLVPNFFDFLWYADVNGNNFSNLPRPNNTCLVRVLNVRQAP